MRIVRYTYPQVRRFTPVQTSFPRGPWSGLESEIERLFDTALSDFAGAASEDRFPVDLYEDKDNVHVRAELPGVNRADLQVELVEGRLVIAAVRKTKEGENEDSVSLSRSIVVPDSVQADKIAAVYENGILSVTLPKKEEAKPRKIAVTVN